MAGYNREAPIAALFARLQTKLGTAAGGPVVTFSRRYMDFSEVPTANQPALLVVEDDQVPSTTYDGAAPVWTLRAWAIAYVTVPQTDAAPGTVLNDIVTRIETALQRQADEQFVMGSTHQDTTLGGLVTRARIDGAVEIYMGQASGQAIALVPISLYAPSNPSR